MNRPHRHLVTVIALCSTLLALVACRAAGGDSATKKEGGLTVIKIGSEKVTSDAGIFLADRLGYFKQVGLKIQYVRLTNAPAITNALATGDLEVAGASLAPGVFSSLNSGIDIRLVGDKQSIRPGVSATRFAVKPEFARDSLKATLEALRGKRIAVHSKLSIQVFMLNNMLARNGMSLRDFKIVPVLSPDQISAFKGGSIDAAVMLEPFLTQGLQLGIVKPSSDLTEGTPGAGEVLTGLLYGKKLIEERKLGDDFMVAYMRGVRAYNDALFGGKDQQKDKVFNIIAQETNKPLDLVKETFPCGLEPDQQLDVPYLNKLQDFYVGQRMLNRPGDVSKLVDTSYADHARAKLGPYKAAKKSSGTS